MWRLGLLSGLLVASSSLAAARVATAVTEVEQNQDTSFYDSVTNDQNRGTILGTENNPDPVSENCQCVPYYSCTADNVMKPDGIIMFDPRIGTEKDNTCGSAAVVCCNPPNATAEMTLTRSPSPSPSPGSSSSPLSSPSLAEIRSPKVLGKDGCGRRNPTGVGISFGLRSLGPDDDRALFGEFPWMITIFKKNDVTYNGSQESVNVYQCGGALIHPKVVLTAAHHVARKKPDAYHVRAGEWNLDVKNETYPPQDRKISKIIVHEKFNVFTFSDNIALLILDRPFDFAENVGVVCLPKPEDRFESTRCLSSGWGKNAFGVHGYYQVVLKKVELPIVSDDTCQAALRRTRMGPGFRLHSSFLCAGGELGRDTCQGDGGSPLVCPLKNDPDRYVEVGVVAWGIGCGDAGIPGVYSNVAAARTWIDRTMKSNELNSSSYTY